MKAKILLLVALFIVMSTTINYAQADDERLGKYLNTQDYFGLNEFLLTETVDASDYMLLLSKAVAGYHFNRPHETVEFTLELLSNYQDIIGSSNAINMSVILAEAYGLQGKYNDAANIYDKLILQLKEHVNIEEMGFDKRYKQFKVLADANVLPQKMILNKTTTIPTKFDKHGLTTVPIKIGDFSSNFVFDTGAGFSVIPEEYAIKAGVKILDYSVMAMGVSLVPMKLGYAEKLSIGDMIIENTIFLINPKKITIAEVPDYEIKGIIGLYTMLCMGEVQLDKKGTLTIPKTPTDYAINNLLVNGSSLQPMVQAFSNNDTLLMVFDTGGTEGGMSSRYYNKHKQLIEQTCKPDLVNAAGIGESKKGIKTYALQNFPIKVDDSEMVFPKMQVEVGEENSALQRDGVIGANFIKLFNKTIINFKSMYVTFE